MQKPSYRSGTFLLGPMARVESTALSASPFSPWTTTLMRFGFRRPRWAMASHTRSQCASTTWI